MTLYSHVEPIMAIFLTPIPIVWQHIPSPNVKLCLTSAVVTVSSVHVLFASHYWTVRMFQQWGAYQYHKSWFFLISLMLRCPAFLSFFSAHVSSHASPRFHPRFTRFSTTLTAPPTVIISDPTESRSRNRTHDRTIAPKVAAVASYFFPKSFVECILGENLLFLFCFSHIAWYSSE